MNSVRRFVRINDIQAFYLVFTLLFLSTGFLYNFVFFSYFKVRVDLFFTLQDYLSTSIEKVYLVFVTVAIALSSNIVVKYLIREKNELATHKFVECDRETLFLLPPSLQDWLPEGHLAR
ncbi:MAG TPA: hypothetical protein VMJ66_13035, partial [Geobacteraceae bacterium]|nr:hypothetical protein [Geobacteraceae bacterium]